MSTPARAEAVRVPVGDEKLDLGLLIDWSGLRRRGWDPDGEVFAPGAEDPVFGFALCASGNCDQMVHHPGLGLCRRCQNRWEHSPSGMSFEEFCQSAPARIKPVGGGLCLVCRTSGHERPVRGGGLCTACMAAARDRGQSVAAYVAGDAHFPPAAPRPTFGTCAARACVRLAHRAEPALCETHERTWIRDGRPTGRSFEAWCARARALDVGSRVVVLAGLSESAELEVLYGLHRAVRDERRTHVKALQGAVGRLRARGAISAADVAVDGLPRDARSFLLFIRDRVGLASTSPVEEMAKDCWDLRVLGRDGGRIQFGHLSQAWLREGAKAWTRERLDTVETPARLDQVIHDLGPLSESLRRHRTDRGADPWMLGRADALALANDLAHLEAAGRLSRYMRRRVLLDTDQFLRESRSMGLMRAGQPMAGLPEDVVFPSHDRVRAVVDDDERGRALPQVVLDQLLDPAALDWLDTTFDVGTRAMVELQALVGRRTAELCGLAWDCLRIEEVLDESGAVRPSPVLAHDMPKVAVRRFQLPIDGHAAEIIRDQQARVRDRYPDTPTSQLTLFPALARNPRGVKPFNRITFTERLRVWVHELPRLVGPDGADYDRADITPYSFRHTYAQRHADAGTPVEVLAALMGHRKLTTTQGYYRVTHKRKRNAVDQLASLQLNRRGERARPAVERLLESEHLRDAVGQVAVPFGICQEPTNVKAHGQACPFRHQCFGCTHFRTDPSYLPELRTHLQQLLADDERLRAAAPELEDWARNAAIPSGEEIAAVRQIIDRCQTVLAGLPEGERTATEDAITVLRRSRAQLDTTVPVRFLGVIGSPTPRLFPNVIRDQEMDDGR
jgi:integrase